MFKRHLCLSTVLVSGILLGAFSAQAIETKARNLCPYAYRRDDDCDSSRQRRGYR